MRSVGWALVQTTHVLIGTGNLDTDTQKEDHVRTQGEVSHLQPRREASGETKPADTFTSDFQPPEL